MSAKLKPCCDAPNITRRIHFPSRSYEMKCENCGQCVEGINKADAVGEWNRRAVHKTPAFTKNEHGVKLNPRAPIITGTFGDLARRAAKGGRREK